SRIEAGRAFAAPGELERVLQEAGVLGPGRAAEGPGQLEGPPELQLNPESVNSILRQFGIEPRTPEEIDAHARAIVERQAFEMRRIIERELERFEEQFPREFAKAQERIQEQAAMQRAEIQEDMAA